VVGFGKLERLPARADLGGDAVQFIIEDVAEALGEDEGEDDFEYYCIGAFTATCGS
jgi:hypothetical protein